MARARRETTAPPKRDVYVGMLFVTVLSMCAGITVLALEGEEYGWESQPKGGPTIQLPTMPKLNLDADAGGGAAPAPPVQPAPMNMGQATPLAPPLAEKPVALSDPAPRPAAAPLVPPVLTPLAPVVTAPAPVQPAPTVPLNVPVNTPAPDRGPQPGFFLNVPRAPGK